MTSGPARSRRVKIKATAIVEITDERAVIDEAMTSLAAADFTGGEDERETRRAEIKGDSIAAVGWLVDPFGLLADIPGAQVVGSEDQVVEIDEAGREHLALPDFAALFPLCRCGRDSCDACTGYQLTPRTAAVLWTVAQVLADQGYDDVVHHGDEPAADDDLWALFNRYPRITWTQDAVWRRQAARAYDDLTQDIGTGRWPRPRCPGEELALHLILDAAPDAADDGWAGLDDTLSRLPQHPDDLDWDMASDVLFQDHDILDLFNIEMDGLEDPDTEQNRAIGMGDYRPQAWFRTFLNMDPRDGRRSFRR